VIKVSVHDRAYGKNGSRDGAGVVKYEWVHATGNCDAYLDASLIRSAVWRVHTTYIDNNETYTVDLAGWQIRAVVKTNVHWLHACGLGPTLNLTGNNRTHSMRPDGTSWRATCDSDKVVCSCTI
jgi:hypothetical protein